ncbi:MAG: tetraacyldisaccharide 4'-kinase [Planctomycetales bacterium]|nr:tetraacyldisaccharide 4'-kinase [Planctomycetales bacterium]
MISPEQFRALVSGQRRGPMATLTRCGLRLAESPYAWAMRVRNWRYDQGRAEITQVDVPVVSVGNLSMGGTGKTPLVEWIARWYRQRDVRVALISRGYGAERAGANDEALELEERLPDVPHLQNPDRVAAAQVAVDELEMQVLVLDDGFQHRRLYRDLDIVLLDALEPFGYEHVFPRGTLREPPRGLERADVVVLSRADAVDAAEREQIRTRVAKLAPAALWCELVHRPRRMLNCSGDELPLDAFAGQRVAAFCGIGNPAGFQHTLEQCKFEAAELRAFADHYDYSRKDLDELTAWARDSGAKAAICTHKDLVKLQVLRLGDIPLWAVSIEATFLAGQAEFEAKLPPVEP